MIIVKNNHIEEGLLKKLGILQPTTKATGTKPSKVTFCPDSLIPVDPPRMVIALV